MDLAAIPVSLVVTVDEEVAADDERFVHITLTEAGQKLKPRAQPICQAVVDAYGLDERGFNELLDELRELTESMNAQGSFRDSHPHEP